MGEKQKNEGSTEGMAKIN